DLARRDFTMNAMALSSKSPPSPALILDPFGGRRDLARRRLRAVSAETFREDPLRALRAFRFAAQFDLRFEPATWRRIMRFAKKAPEGLGVSAERLREEILRLLSSSRAATALADLDRAGLTGAIFPSMEAGRRVAVRYYGK